MDLANAKVDGDIFIGKSDAPLTMTYCSTTSVPSASRSKRTYTDPYHAVREHGQTQDRAQGLSVLGQDSLIAAEYSHAIWDLYPDKFFAWHQPCSTCRMRKAIRVRGCGHHRYAHKPYSGIDDGK